MLKNLASIVLCSAFLVGCSQTYTINELSKGSASKIIKRLEVVIDDEYHLKFWWTKSSNEPIPKIDFSKNSVVAVYSGEKPTGGYSIEITKIQDSRTMVYIYVKETIPKPGDIVTQEITYPYHIIKTEKIIKGERFIR